MSCIRIFCRSRSLDAGRRVSALLPSLHTEAAIRYRLLAIALLTALQVQAQTVRFAWLTDTHVGGATGADDLRTAIRAINRLDSVDFAVISGDVTESGTNRQLLEAHALLDSLRMPYHIIPGNHDTKWSESGGTMFRRIWGDDRFVFSSGRYLFVGMHQGPRMRMGDGHWAPEDIRWFDTVLTRVMTSQKKLVFITHYPLDSSITNWYEVLDRLKRVNTVAILHGHGHRNRQTAFEGIPAIMSRSDLSAGQRGVGFTLVELGDDTLRVFEVKAEGERPVMWASVATERPADTATVAHGRPALSPGGVRQTAWRRNFGYTIAAAPVVEGGRVFVADGSGTLRALNLKTGKELWSFRSDGPVWGTPGIAAGSLVFGSADGAVYCVSTANGRMRWKVQTRGPVVGAPAIADGVVYLGGSDSTFRAIDLRSGRVLWAYDDIGGYVEAKPLVLKDKVVFGAWDTYLYALNRQSGTLDWRWKGDRPGTLYSPAACWPVETGGRIYVVAPDRMMTAIDAASGATLWRTGTYQVRETIGLSADKKLLFARTMRDTIVALDARQAPPTPVWVTDVGFGYDINSAMIAERDGTVFYGTKDGLLVALDAHTGAVQWKERVSIGLLQTVAPVNGSSVVWSSTDGSVGFTRTRGTD